MTTPTRLRAIRIFGLLATGALSAQVPLPLPPAAQVLKPLAGKVVDAVLKPKMKVDHFTLGGFKVVEVDPTGEATAEAFEGTGIIDLPAPAMRLKVTFKHLVLKGTAAEGTVEVDFPTGHKSDHQGWTYRLRKAVISDKGSHLEGLAELAGFRLEITPLAFGTAGLQGTLTAGDVPLAEGPFTAILKGAEVLFASSAPPQLKGTVAVELALPVRHALTGEPVTAESTPVIFSSQVLMPAGTGLVVDGIGADLPLLHKGATWRVERLAFAFLRGVPRLGGPTRLQFPLNVFCKVGATDQPYLTGPAPCTMEGRAVKLPESGPARVLAATRKTTPLIRGMDLFMGFEGFSASFPLVPATVHPSGLTAYQLTIQGGVADVRKGLVEPDGSKLTGMLSFGPERAYKLTLDQAPVSLSDGLYATAGLMTTPAQVGAYGVQSWIGAVACDFSDSRSPKDLDAGWMGVFLPGFRVTLPEELYKRSVQGKRIPAVLHGLDGRFEGNGTFSAALHVEPKDPVMLQIAPVRLQPFDLTFVDGVILDAPLVKGTLEVDAPPILAKYTAPVSFRLAQDGVKQIEVQGGQVLDTGLIGVDTVLDRAVLTPDSLDFTGRFDFHVAGANLPSIEFEHLIFQAMGGGVDGTDGPLKLSVAGEYWSSQADMPKVNLWGFDFDVSESGFGVSKDGRYFVGFGGQMDINPLLPGISNRVVFTTESGNPGKGIIELPAPFTVDQGMSGLGQLKADMGFHVNASGDQVSTAYFQGTGHLKMDFAQEPITVDAGVRFGRQMEPGGGSFPYFYALGHVESNMIHVPVAPDVEIYGFVGGLAQNFKPTELRDTSSMEGTPDKSLGYALVAGVDVGTTDQYVFHGGLDLYISQNLTTLLQGKGWLFCTREEQENEVTANVAFTRNPNVFDATFTADIAQAGGSVRFLGNVAMHFGPDKRFIHVGAPDMPIKVVMSGLAEGNGYLMADFEGGASRLSAGAGFGVDTGQRSFGPLYGRAWLNARGDVVIELDAQRNPHLKGVLQANGGATFGMEFETFWDTYNLTIFSGDFSAAMAFQAPGSPKLSGRVIVHYSVLGGLFDGSVGAQLDF